MKIKRLAAVMLALAAVMVLHACGSAEVDFPGVYKESMFECVEQQADWKIVADRNTGVMYAVSAGGYNRGTFTLLVDAEGKPIIYKEAAE